jgi:hypothetical protein
MPHQRKEGRSMPIFRIASLALALWAGASFAHAQIGAGDTSGPDAVADPSTLLGDRSGGTSTSNAGMGTTGALADRPGSAAGGSDLGSTPGSSLGGATGAVTGGGLLAPGGSGSPRSILQDDREGPGRR